jgi:hypothetical protein
VYTKKNYKSSLLLYAVFSPFQGECILVFGISNSVLLSREK